MKKIFTLLAFLTMFMEGNAQHATWKELLANGDAEKSWAELGLADVAYNDMENNWKVCFWTKEKGVNNHRPHPAEIIAEEDGNHVFICRAQAANTPGEASAWDNQIWIESPHSWSTGETFRLSFRYKASKPVVTSTQVHYQTPSEYLFWQGIGDISFTTEWQTFERDVAVSADGMWSVAFNLNPNTKTPVDFYLDDLSWQELKVEEAKPEIYPNPTVVIVHGQERDYLTADGNGNPREEQIGTGQYWDNQFFLVANRTLSAGEQTVISFDYNASRDAHVSTECHQAPGSYLHWSCVGDVNFTTEEKHFERAFTIPSQADGMQCIAFDMAHIREACDYTLKNFVWKLADDSESLIDMEDTNSFYLKEGAKKPVHQYVVPETGDAQLVINEIMQSNIDCIMDDLNEFPDSWVELYNAGTASADLVNYKIGLSSDVNKAWPLSSAKVKPNGFAIVYCDKTAKGNHTDFRLDSDKGGAVYLFKNGEVIDSYTSIPAQLAPNVSYGRKTEASDELGFQYSATPSRVNCGNLCTKLLGKPVFSVPGFVSSTRPNIAVEISLPNGAPEDAEIRYTTDGTEPTKNSTLYTKAITVRGSKVIRAKAFCDGYVSDRSRCESYIYHERAVTLPVVSITSDDAYFYDGKIGIINNANNNQDTKNDWRRPINIEYFVPSKDKSVINQLCETRVSGGASRGAQLKSLVVYANKRFGTKRLKYEFFPTQRPGVDKFKSIVLRNAGNDFDYLYMRDAVMQRSVAEHVDLDWQAWQPAIFYLNGKYMGMLNVRERSNEDNVYSNYDGLEDIDLFENSQLKAGTWDDFNAFREFYNSHDHTYAEYDELMDIDEFQNYYVMQMYYNNQDWPGNNNVQWKPRTAGGKWRWIAKDTDFGLGLYNHPASYNMVEWMYDNSYDSDRNWANTSDATRLFRRLMEIEQFKWEFLDKVAVYTGDFMSADSVKALIDEMHGEIEFEYPNHRKLFNEWWPNYNDELRNAKNWITSRGQYFFEHLANHYSLGSVLTGKINNLLNPSEYNNLELTVNDIPLTGGAFNGRFFNGRSLTIKGSCTDDSKEITGWKVVSKDRSNKTTTTTYDGPNFTFTPTNLSSVAFNAILEDVSGIEDVMSDSSADVQVYDINGRKLHGENQARGIYIIKSGNKSKKVAIF